MERRTFARLSLLGLAVPLVARAAPAARGQRAKQAPALSVTEVVANVDAVYNPLSTFMASFKQRYSVPIRTADASGSVMFEKPGKMSWRYGNGNRVVSDGKIVQIYERGSRQLYVRAPHKTVYTAALSFLMGQGSLSHAFTFALHDSARLKYAQGYVLRGVSRQANAAFSRVFYYVDATTFHVRRVVMLDAQGNRSRFDFANPIVNAQPPPGAFVLVPPPGTQVIAP